MRKKNILVSFAVSTLLFSSIANAKINEEDYKISSDEIKSAKEIKLDNQNLIIDKEGVYLFFGKLENQNITIDVKDDETVKIILDGVNIKSSNNPAIYVKNAKKTIIVTTKGSKNYLSDSSNNSESAALYSKDDLVILGNGLLDIQANKNDAIKSNDELYLNANITLESADDGIIGKDSIIVDGGTYKIISNGDGLKSSNDEDSQKGFIEINGGSFNISTYNDAIQVVSNLKINDGKFNIKTTGEKSKKVSSKGLKSSNNIELNGGEFIFETIDDSIHSNDSITINNGKFNISSKDDAVHAEKKLIVNDGEIIVTNSYEALEANEIEINGGYMNLLSSDDTLNGAGGYNPNIKITGGRVIIDAEGDGIDVNGDMQMSGGTVIVNGPTKRGNGPLDYDGDFEISGGVLVATGSSGMAQAPGQNSTQYSFLMELDPAISAGTFIHVKEKDAESIFSFKISKLAQNIAFSSSKLKDKTTYEIYTGGNDLSKGIDELYLTPNYSNGTVLKTFTTEGIVTSDVKRKGRGGPRKGWFGFFKGDRPDHHKGHGPRGEGDYPPPPPKDE